MMKTLKFDHEAADLIRKNKKTATWRMYDDKDLSVNDRIRLIDKVDPERPETWKVIGVARIDSVVQKRLEDVRPEDHDDSDADLSPEKMLDVMRSYYSNDVTFTTPVKIIRFTLDNNNEVTDEIVDEKTTNLTEVKLYADGGSRGNPGPSAYGFAILDMDDNIVVKKGEYLGVTTNNQAEYHSLKSGLEEVKRMRVRRVHVYMDSLLVVNQMLGVFKVKNRDIWPIHAAIKDLVSEFDKVTFTHVPRKLNAIADSAVNEALDHVEKQQRGR